MWLGEAEHNCDFSMTFRLVWSGMRSFRIIAGRMCKNRGLWRRRKVRPTHVGIYFSEDLISRLTNCSHTELMRMMHSFYFPSFTSHFFRCVENDHGLKICAGDPCESRPCKNNATCIAENVSLWHFETICLELFGWVIRGNRQGGRGKKVMSSQMCGPQPQEFQK